MPNPSAKKTFLRIICLSCAVFTAMILLICFGVGLAGAEGSYGISPKAAFGIFAFSFTLSVLTQLCAIMKIPFFFRALIHLTVTVALSAACMRAANRLEGKTILYISLVIIVFHIAASFVVASVCRRKKRDEEYKNVYGKIKNSGEKKDS